MKQAITRLALCAVLATAPITAKNVTLKRKQDRNSLYAQYPKACIAGAFSVAALCGAGFALWYTQPELTTFQKNLNWILGDERGIQVGNYCAAGYGYFLGHKMQIKYAAGGFGVGLANGALLGVFATWLYHKLLTTKKAEQKMVMCPPSLVAQVQQLVYSVQTQQKQSPDHQL